MFKLKFKYFIYALILFFIEVLIALYVNDSIIRPHVGDFLVVIFLYCTIMSIFNIRVLMAAIAVLIFAFLVEFLQYLKIVEVIDLENNKIALVVIGSSFSWIDLLCYILGILLVVLMERRSIRLKKT